MTLKVPTKSDAVREILDWFLVITFVVLVPLAFVTVALLKFYRVNAALKALFNHPLTILCIRC